METSTALAVLYRWLHITSGVFWIGLLYYFNVVQVPVFKKFDAATRSLAIQKLVPVALAWFRFSALSTVVFGLLVLYQQDQMNGTYMSTDRGMIISSGMLLGLIMAFNVWALIWPNQKKIIEANRAKAATGQEIPPASAQWAKTAFYASRTNFVLSFPMLFFMVSAPHPIGTANETIAVGAGILVLALVALWLFTSMKPAATKTGGTTPATKP
jgi:uncharacterized membrane protein